MRAEALHRFLLQRKRIRRHWSLFASAFIFGLLCTILLVSSSSERPLRERPPRPSPILRRLLQSNGEVEVVERLEPESVPTTPLPLCKNASGNSSSGGGGGQFPEDLFSMHQKRHGAIVLHFLCLCYMFVALAIVCDEFFVPALGVITEKLQISDDVAGATFMAAGGSAPEFFTSVIGVFIAQDNVGIGTIVGSATFNILCVLAFCTLFSKGVLHLTWWPLFRDVSFYILALALIVVFFIDEAIEWWEALVLFIIYLAYCTFMKFNEELEILVKTRVLGQSIQVEEVAETVAETEAAATEYGGGGPPGQLPSRTSTASGDTHSGMPGGVPRRRSISVSSSGRRQSIPILRSGAMFRNGIVQLMVHTLDPLSELPGTPEDEEAFPAQNNGGAVTGAGPGTKLQSLPSLQEGEEANYSATAGRSGGGGDVGGGGPYSSYQALPANGRDLSPPAPVARRHSIKEVVEEIIDEVEEPLDISWPQSWRKRITYVLLAPIVLMLWATLPDVRKPSSRRWFPMTFVGSILWIAFYSWLMVWMATEIGNFLEISIEIMGLTILAAGTSIPDLITSVIVARKGLGDMAVSSSIGSNIFDVCVGLPIPWLLYFLINTISPGADYEGVVLVISKGLACSVGMLFVMLIVLMISIAAFNWSMSKPFGVVMLLAYVAFAVISVFLETDRLPCFLKLSQAKCRSA